MVYPCLCLRYAPALRQLRQVAFLVTFPPTIPARLAARLLEVMFVCVRGGWQRGLEPSLHDRPKIAPVKKFGRVRLSTNFP